MEEAHLDIILSQIEKEKNITIICVVECGSRAYGLNSVSSDYDIRYIYIKNNQKVYKTFERGKVKVLVKNRTNTHKWYIVGDMILNVTGKKYIQNYLLKTKNPVVVDLHGWDISFAVRMLHIMNPSIVEWMFSPIVYRNKPEYDFLKRACQLLIRQKRSYGLISHYRGMAKKYFKKYLKDNDMVRVKKYIHCVRSCIMVAWLQINKQKQFQPMIQVNFNQVLNDLKPYMSTSLFNSTQKLVNKKKTSDKETIGPRDRALDQFIQGIFKMKVNMYGEKKHGPKMKAYNRFLNKCLFISYERIQFAKLIRRNRLGF